MTISPKAPARKRASRAKTPTATTAKSTAATTKATASYVRHSKRPDWGIGRITDEFVGLVRVRFSDGVSREFRDSVLEAVDVSELSEAAFAVVSEPDVPRAAPAPTRVPRVRKATSD